MRIEARIEIDEHDYVVSIECDYSVNRSKAIELAAETLITLSTPNQLPF